MLHIVCMRHGHAAVACVHQRPQTCMLLLHPVSEGLIARISGAAASMWHLHRQRRTSHKLMKHFEMPHSRAVVCLPQGLLDSQQSSLGTLVLCTPSWASLIKLARVLAIS